MNVLIIGSGGREHALAWKISQSPLTGFSLLREMREQQAWEKYPVSVTDFPGIREMVTDQYRYGSGRPGSAAGGRHP